MAKNETTTLPGIDLTADKPAESWTREQRIEWALAKFGVEAPYVWFIYRVGERNQHAKVDEVDGLNVEEHEDAIVRRHGGGKFFRQLRIRGNSRVPGIVSEYVTLAEVLGARAPFGSPAADPIEERLTRIEKALDRFAGGMPPAPGVGAFDPAAQAQAMMQMSMQMAQMISAAARPATPVDELLKIKRVAEQLLERGERDGRGDRRGRDDDEGEGFVALGRQLMGIVRGIGEALPRPAPAGQGHTARGLPPAPAPHVGTPGARKPATPTPAPDRAPEPAPVAASEPTPQYMREPFPGCFDIVEAVQADPALIPVSVGRNPADECEALIRVMFEKIEGAAGDPRLVANRLGAKGIVDAFVGVYPDAEPFRAMMERAAQVFVEAANDDGEDDDEADDDASVAAGRNETGGQEE